MINWKLRFQNRATLAAIVATSLLLARQLGFSLPANIEQVADTGLTLLALIGVISDPTTKGLADSRRAMTYDEPH